MRTLFLASCLMAFGLSISGCTTDKDAIAPETLSANLFGRLWLNSYEAKADQVPTYRPQGYTWPEPPMRYNVPFEGGDGFRFEQDGTLTYIAPGIGPGPTTHAGIWWRDDPSKQLFRIHLTDNYLPDFQLQISSVSDDLLRATYVR